jgi:hypothetical protein
LRAVNRVGARCRDLARRDVRDLAFGPWRAYTHHACRRGPSITVRHPTDRTCRRRIRRRRNGARTQRNVASASRCHSARTQSNRVGLGRRSTATDGDRVRGRCGILIANGNCTSGRSRPCRRGSGSVPVTKCHGTITVGGVAQALRDCTVAVCNIGITNCYGASARSRVAGPDRHGRPTGIAYGVGSNADRHVAR